MLTMPEEPQKETPARQATALTSDADVPGADGNEEQPFAYLLKIGDVYDGPLDLLLDLIKKQNLDIWDLSIGKITAQFLAYAKTIPPEEADSAAEFCYMASQLIVIKSRMLLPIERAEAENGAAEDPRKSLIERLLEYEQVKQAAQMLAARQRAESAIWTRSDAGAFRDAASKASSAQPADGADLSNVFRQILERAANRPTLTVTNDRRYPHLSRRRGWRIPFAADHHCGHCRSARDGSTGGGALEAGRTMGQYPHQKESRVPESYGCKDLARRSDARSGKSRQDARRVELGC
jgi:chromatin segregation and condensation protein Rec8/ScpA/Scc1 (kleisin family)